MNHIVYMMFISLTMSIFDILSYCSILLCIVTCSKTCTILVTVLMVDIGHETAAGRNTIKSLSLSCRHLFFLSILKTIRSERAESFSLRQGVRFIIDMNEGDAPVRQITNGKIQNYY